MNVAKRIRITGKVQGVAFRAWAKQLAAQLGLIGWVRNREDGSVEILAKGEADAVQQLLESCSTGPTYAVVERVEAEPAKGITPARFDIKPTV